MTVKEAYKNYYQYCKDSETWTWDFIKDNLKKSWIDYEEYNFEEFKDKILTDDKFNERWANGCTRELSLEDRLLLADKINKEIRQDLYTYAFNNPIYTGGIDQRPDDVEKHHLLNDLNIPTKTIID